MLSPYRSILMLPGALAFSLVGLFARLEISMVGLGTVLLLQRTTGSYAIAGLVAGTYGVGASLAAPWIARIIDRFGQAAVLRRAIVVHAVALLGMIAAAVAGLPIAVVLVLAAIGGASQLSVGSMVRARWALLVSGTPSMQTAFALESVFDEVVFIVGPIVVTLLAAFVHPAIGVLIAIATAIVGAIVLAAQRSTQPPTMLERRESAAEAAHAQSSAVLRMRGMIVLVVVSLGAGGIFGSAEVTVAAFTKAAGQPASAGFVLAIWAAGSLLAGFTYGAIRWRGPVHRRFAILTVLLALFMVPTVFVPNIPLLAVVFLFAGLAVAPVITATSTLVESLVPARRLTEGLAWTSTALGLSYSIAAAIAGSVIDASGPRAGFLVPIGFATVAAVTALIGVRRLRPMPAAEQAVR